MVKNDDYFIDTTKYTPEEIKKGEHYIELLKELDTYNYDESKEPVSMWDRHRAVQIMSELSNYEDWLTSFFNVRSLMWTINLNFYRSLYYYDPSPVYNRFEGELNWERNEGWHFVNNLDHADDIAIDLIKQYLEKCVIYAKRTI